MTTTSHLERNSIHIGERRIERINDEYYRASLPKMLERSTSMKHSDTVDIYIIPNMDAVLLKFKNNPTTD